MLGRNLDQKWSRVASRVSVHVRNGSNMNMNMNRHLTGSEVLSLMLGQSSCLPTRSYQIGMLATGTQAEAKRPDDGHFYWSSPWNMTVFPRYVKLPEDNQLMTTGDTVIYDREAQIGWRFCFFVWCLFLQKVEQFLELRGIKTIGVNDCGIWRLGDEPQVGCSQSSFLAKMDRLMHCSFAQQKPSLSPCCRGSWLEPLDMLGEITCFFSLVARKTSVYIEYLIQPMAL